MHCHLLAVGHQAVTDIRLGGLPVVGLQADVLLGDGEAAGHAAPVGVDPHPPAQVSHLPPRPQVSHLYAKVGRLAGRRHAVAETFCAAVGIGRQQGEVTGLAAVAAWAGGVALAAAVTGALAALGAGQAARTGHAAGIAGVAGGTAVAARPSEAGPAQAVAGFVALMGQLAVRVAEIAAFGT